MFLWVLAVQEIKDTGCGGYKMAPLVPAARRRRCFSGSGIVARFSSAEAPAPLPSPAAALAVFRWRGASPSSACTHAGLVSPPKSCLYPR